MSGQRSSIRIYDRTNYIPALRIARGNLVFGASPPAVLGATDVAGVLMLLAAGVLSLDAGAAAIGAWASS